MLRGGQERVRSFAPKQDGELMCKLSSSCAVLAVTRVDRERYKKLGEVDSRVNRSMLNAPNIARESSGAL
jgi:hypothetical protein